MTESETNSESRVKAVLNDDLLASLVLVSNAAAEMADRLKMLMEMHARVAPITGQHLGNRGLEDWGREAHWWMENLGDYFNATDAVDDEDPRDQSWDVAFDAARKFFPLANVKEHATLAARASVDHGVEVEGRKGHENRAADRGCCVSTCSLSSIRESMLYAACDSEDGIILTPMNGSEIVLNDVNARQLGEWLLHITSQDSKSRRSVDSSVTAACPSDDSTPNS